MTEAAGSDIHILVADDENVVLSLVRDALEDDGFKVLTAQNGLDALKHAKTDKIDLVVSDIRMPKMDGIELVKKVRELHPDVAAIFMTGYANLNSAKDAIKQGAFDYIMKPFELNEIRQAVHKAVDRIRKETQAKNSDKQLDRLSVFNQMLFTAGDKKSLITVSLKFALMHCRAQCGAVLYWNYNRSNIRLIVVNNDESRDVDLPDEEFAACLNSVDLKKFQEPLIVNGSQEHPLLEVCPVRQLEKYLNSYVPGNQEPVIVVPVSRSYTIYGLMMIYASDKSILSVDANLKFLTIAAHQLAMSLENIDLLDESQKAYIKLKELQDETIQLEKMATRGEMSAEIGHELNNFLGVVAGSLSMLDYQLRKKNYEELDRYVTAMTDNIEKIKKFTSNLMELQPISTRKETVYFDMLIKEVIDYLKPQKRFRDVKINFAPIDNELPFEADGTHIQQVLYNLFNNAADATEGRPEREISVSTAIHPDGNSFRMTIQDTGVGIEPELLKKAFYEKFTTKEKGHGFGLLVCKRIIDGHNGILKVDSTPGQGTSISIEFPLKTKEQPEAVLS